MATELDVRKSYLGLGAGDLAELTELRPLLERSADDFTEMFYRHLLAFEHPRSLLTDSFVRDRLRSVQKQYYVSLADARIDEAYAARRAQLGRLHEAAGLSAGWYIGAYSLYLRAVCEQIETLCGGDVERERRMRSALERRLLFDLELAMEAYIEKREEQLAFLNRELAATQRGLSREVDEQRVVLNAATARARAAEQLASVGMLAAGLAHEIGTPMGVIRGHAESLERDVHNERAAWRVKTIVEQIDRIANIMQSLLNLARPRQPVVEPVELERVIETALSFLHDKLARRGIDVALFLGSGWTVRGDVEKLQQLFLNLILNAADAMQEGGTLRIEIAESEDGQIVACVADTGVGIEPEIFDRVFEPFFTTKPAGQGNGLGLVVARGIAIDHGGDIAASSEPGRGTEFRVELPAASD